MTIAMTAAGYVLTVLASLYALLALCCHARIYRSSEARRCADTAASRLPITVLKPLCGIEPKLEDNLATLCDQTYPVYQLLFGVRDPHDPAIAAIERLKIRYPRQDIQLVVDPRVHGSNFKVSNLMNMMGAARYPWLVIADSDIAVRPDYLDKVSAPLEDPAVGIVTCLYRGRALDAFWSRLGALFIDTWFAPSVRVASAFGSSSFGFGATIALRASTLTAIGGFQAIRNRLADDFWLGQLTRNRGLATVISEVCVTTDVTESDFPSMWSRERRWMQTIRAINPLGYTFTFVTFTLPVLAIGLCLAPTPWNWACALPGVAARLGLHLRKPAADLPAPGYAYLAPLRDCLLVLLWLSAFLGATTQWRKQTVRIDDPAEPIA